MPIDYFNPTPIYYSDVSPEQFLRIKNEVDKNISDEMYRENKWVDLVNTTMNFSPNIVKELNLIEIESLIVFHMNVFLKELKMQKNFYIFNSWFNKLPKYGCQNLHVHTPKDNPGTNKIYSGVYFYEKLERTHEALHFLVKNSFSEMGVKYDYVPGRIIIFNGLLPHEVHYNKTDEERTSFSFNIQLI